MKLDRYIIISKFIYYRFDEVFPSSAPQSMIFEKVASPMIDK